MGVFNSAIQTLSEMAIKESGVTIPETAKITLIEDFKSTLEDLPTLSADECRFDVRMVPVKENSRLGKYLIEMEDLSRYMMTNGIASAKEAIANILECNNLVGQFHKVALVIDEASILDEMENLGAGIDGEYPEPTPGLGHTIFGAQDNFKYIRRIANSKELLDTLYNKYGLPFVKKNYNVGLAEDVKPTPQPGQQTLQEKDPNNANPNPAQPVNNNTNNATPVANKQVTNEGASLEDIHSAKVNEIRNLLTW